MTPGIQTGARIASGFTSAIATGGVATTAVSGELAASVSGEVSAAAAADRRGDLGARAGLRGSSVAGTGFKAALPGVRGDRGPRERTTASGGEVCSDAAVFGWTGRRGTIASRL
jgi:hypothetical protein